MAAVGDDGLLQLEIYSACYGHEGEIRTPASEVVYLAVEWQQAAMVCNVVDGRLTLKVGQRQRGPQSGPLAGAGDFPLVAPPPH